MEKKPKKGYVEALIVAGVVVVVLLICVVGGAYALDNVLPYYGNPTTKIAYPTETCKSEIYDIPKWDRVIFSSIAHIEDEGYKYNGDCE